MSILIDKNTRLIVQGITGRDGAFHTQQMIAYGTKVVGGVTPGKGGTTMHGVPVFDTVAEAVEQTQRQHLRDLRAGRRSRPTPSTRPPTPASALIVCITEGLPVRDTLAAWHKVMAHARRQQPARQAAARRPELPRTDHARARPRSASCPGQICTPGPVGVVQQERHAHVRGREAADATRDSARPPASASAAIRSSAPTSSTR